MNHTQYLPSHFHICLQIWWFILFELDKKILHVCSVWNCIFNVPFSYLNFIYWYNCLEDPNQLWQINSKSKLYKQGPLKFYKGSGSNFCFVQVIDYAFNRITVEQSQALSNPFTTYKDYKKRHEIDLLHKPSFYKMSQNTLKLKNYLKEVIIMIHSYNYTIRVNCEVIVVNLTL